MPKSNFQVSFGHFFDAQYSERTNGLFAATLTTYTTNEQKPELRIRV
jgi:hypothetical protein